jgi:hypothetical protein
MTQRFRLTVRGLALELRGYMDQGIDEDQPTLQQFAEAMTPFGIVAASPAPVDYDPFAISEPDNPPTPEKSREVIEVITELAMVHFMQAQVIRGERATREQAERELARRELHHFETEQENAAFTAQLRVALERIERIREARGNHPECEKHPEDNTITCGWKRAVQDIDKVLAEVPE